jgi:amino acid transporter
VERESSLKPDAIGFREGLVIAVASTAPAYSLAAALGTMTAALGGKAISALLVSFVPMLCVAAAFLWLNRVDPDAGTTFSWASRAFGPYVGWIGGWAVTLTGVLVIGSLAEVAARYGLELVGLGTAAESQPAVVAVAVAAIVVLTAVTVLGIEPSARLQNVLMAVQLIALVVFAAAALVVLFGGSAPAEAARPEAAWLSPFGAGSFDAFVVSGLLVAVFVYWGWESAVNLTEETRDGRRASGRAAVLSTVVLLVVYLVTATALIGIVGPEAAGRFEDEAVLAHAATSALGAPLDKLVVLGVVVSALASTQTTIIPASRTLLSMGRRHAVPAGLAAVHERFRTPHVATVAVGAVALVWYVGLSLLAESFLLEALLALSLLIAFYYALSGFACVVVYRRGLTGSVRRFLLVGVVPLLGALTLTLLLARSVGVFVADPKGESESGSVWLGVAPPLVIAVGSMLVGAGVMLVWRATGGRSFFARPGDARAPQGRRP